MYINEKVSSQKRKKQLLKSKTYTLVAILQTLQ